MPRRITGCAFSIRPGELPFAGHPTLGTCHAWLAAGGVPKRDGLIVQECGLGLVDIRQMDGLLAFRAPPMANAAPLSAIERSAAARLAGVDEGWIVDARHADNGPKWQMLRLRSADDVLAARPQPAAPAGTDVGLVGPYPEGSPVQWELRAFFANQHGTLLEDPVTGSFNAGVAMHLFESGLAAGTLSGRARPQDRRRWPDPLLARRGWIGVDRRPHRHGGERCGHAGVRLIARAWRFPVSRHSSQRRVLQARSRPFPRG